MTEMRIAVDRRSADVHPDMRRVQRFKELFFPGEGVIEIEILLHDGFFHAKIVKGSHII